MADGHSEAAWAHTSMIVAENFNAHRGSRRDKVWAPNECNPLRIAEKKNWPTMPGGFEALKAIYKKKKPPKGTGGKAP